jgi:inorganic pyrophosphatase
LVIEILFISSAIAYWVLPDVYYLTIAQSLKAENPDGTPMVFNPRHPYHAALCSTIGLWAGLVIGYFTEYMTSHTYEPVREVARACSTGAATNIIYGLALGYFSTIVPILCIAITAFASAKMLSFYGVALAALGMLSNLTIGLAIDGYGPISDNAGGIAEMAELGPHVRERTDALDAYYIIKIFLKRRKHNSSYRERVRYRFSCSRVTCSLRWLCNEIYLRIKRHKTL